MYLGRSYQCTCSASEGRWLVSDLRFRNSSAIDKCVCYFENTPPQTTWAMVACRCTSTGQSFQLAFRKEDETYVLASIDHHVKSNTSEDMSGIDGPFDWSMFACPNVDGPGGPGSRTIRVEWARRWSTAPAVTCSVLPRGSVEIRKRATTRGGGSAPAAKPTAGSRSGSIPCVGRCSKVNRSQSGPDGTTTSCFRWSSSLSQEAGAMSWLGESNN